MSNEPREPEQSGPPGSPQPAEPPPGTATPAHAERGSADPPPATETTPPNPALPNSDRQNRDPQNPVTQNLAPPNPAPPNPAPARPAVPAPAERDAPRRTAVLDEAHLGDIEGALGRISIEQSGQQPGLKRRLLTLLAIMGPGLIVMVGDNDAGGVATYAQAGQNYGYSLLWVLLLLVPVLIVNQEMVVRLGAVTGVGHARLINERFGRFWGWFSVGDLFLLNFLTIVTEFIGVSLALSYFGVSKYISVPVAAVVLVAITASGSFRRWERAMLTFIAASLLLVPLFLLSEPRWGELAYHLVVPGIQGGLSSDAVLLIIAVVGTTVAPWQLFFQQSNVIDKRITPRFIRYERADTVIGSVVVVLGAAALIAIADFAVRGTRLAGRFSDALGIANALSAHSRLLGGLFSIVLFDASIIGAAAVTLATSYAFGDVFNLRHSLHRSFSEAKGFYASYTGLVAVAAAIVLIPGAPLGLITTSVQALAGLLLPSASVFLLLLCNDPEVLGPWVNPRWLNILASVIITILLGLSGILMATTLFPGLDTTTVSFGLGIVMTIGLIATAIGLRILRARTGIRATPPAPVDRTQRAGWRMPPLALLKPVTWAPATKLGMTLLRAYLVIAALLLIVKAVQLGST